MNAKVDRDERHNASTNEVELSIEELEEVIAPGITRNHNETLVRDEEIELCVEELEEVIAPGISRNHNETLVRDTAD